MSLFALFNSDGDAGVWRFAVRHLCPSCVGVVRRGLRGRGQKAPAYGRSIPRDGRPYTS
jgi:hypothetical protein